MSWSLQTKDVFCGRSVGCDGEKGLVSWVTGKVRARGAAQCRRKTRIVKIFSRPAKGRFSNMLILILPILFVICYFNL